MSSSLAYIPPGTLQRRERPPLCTGSIHEVKFDGYRIQLHKYGGTRMYHPDIDAWLQSRDEIDRLKQLERKAADAWLDTLSLEQRTVFAALINGGHEGMNQLRMRLIRERVDPEANGARKI